MTDELIKVTGEAEQVVKRIFTLCMEGRGPVQIAKVGRKGAQSHGLQAPAGPQDAQQGGANPYYWHTNTVVRMLERREIEVQEHQAEDLVSGGRTGIRSWRR